jgi:hypothetical protein
MRAADLDRDRERAIDAVDVLNDLVGDLVTGTNVLRDYHSQHANGKVPAELLPGIRRLCVSHLVLGCFKAIEVYERFHDLIPMPLHDEVKALVKEFRARGVDTFRNKVVGHIWDKDRGRPLRLSEITEQLQAVMRNDVDGFLNWINRLQKGEQPGTIADTLERVRNALVEKFKITSDEAMKR